MANRTRCKRVVGMSAESEDGGDGRDEDGERGDREKDADGSDSRSKKEKTAGLGAPLQTRPVRKSKGPPQAEEKISARL